MLSQVLLFIAGFVLLLKGADILTDRAASIAARFRISNFVVGIIIIGIGTSIPELIVSVFSNLQGAPNVGIGAVIGSNTLNILLILGLSALVSPLILTRLQVWRHLPLNIFAVVVSAVFVWFGFSGHIGISRFEGFLLLFLFFIWMYYLYIIGKNSHEPFNASSHSHFSNLLFIVAGLMGVVIGGDWVTQSSVAMAETWGLKQSVIGLTIVGLGTSFPELAASLVAAYKKNYGIAVGNIVGSNIFDFLMIFGLTAAMKPIEFTEPLFLDMWVTIFAAVLLFVAMFVGRKYILKRWQGLVFILLYILYVVYLISIRP